jgi:hypothetical protein
MNYAIGHGAQQPRATTRRARRDRKGAEGAHPAREHAPTNIDAATASTEHASAAPEFGAAAAYEFRSASSGQCRPGPGRARIDGAAAPSDRPGAVAATSPPVGARRTRGAPGGDAFGTTCAPDGHAFGATTPPQ